MPESKSPWLPPVDRRCGQLAVAASLLMRPVYAAAAVTHHRVESRHNRLVVFLGRRIMKILVIILVLAIAGLAGYSWLSMHWSYSSGERAGFVQKLSKKGWVCKTWEGEMAMVTMPGTISEKFYFTVPDDAVAARINSSLGKRVTVHFEQHKWLPSSCFGDTEYFVSTVQVTE
jgi:hypothetical protein